MSSPYQTACDSLSRLLSRRAAEELLGEALRNAGRMPAQATAAEVSAVLDGRVLRRLERIMAPDHARREVAAAKARLLPRPTPGRGPAELAPARPASPAPRGGPRPARPLDEIAREEGITALIVCDRAGKLLRARAPGQDAARIASLAAAAALALENHGRVLALHYETAGGHAFVAVRGDEIVTLMSEADVNIGRIINDLTNQGENP